MTTLASFDRELNETIVKRGFEYYRKGRVKDLEQVDDDVWRALVEGSEVYDVKITIAQDNVKQHLCSCPYDLGEFCKHEIAVLYAIRGDIHGEHLGDKDDKILKRKKKYKTIKEEIQEAVGKFTEQELRWIVIDHAIENEKLRRKILLAVPPPANVSAVSKKNSYIRIIRSCMRENADRGFIGYYEAGPASEAAHNLIEKAYEYIDKNDYANALLIGQALLEAIYPELGSIDDSNGEFGSCIEEAWHILQTIAEKVPPAGPLGNELFSYTLGQVGKEMYADWSVEDDFFTIAALLTFNDERQKQLFQSIDQTLLSPRKNEDSDNWLNEHRAENATCIKLKVLRQLGKNEEADVLMRETIKYPEIREQYLEKLFAKGKFDKAKDIAEEGIIIAKEKKHVGIVRKFEEWLCRIAEAEGDVPKVRVLLRRFFLDGRHHGHEDYESLKKSFENDPVGWEKEYEYLVTALKKKGR